MVSSKNNNINTIKQEHGLVITFSLTELSLQNHKCHLPRQANTGPFLEAAQIISLCSLEAY